MSLAPETVSRFSQYFTSGVTKAVIYAILSVGLRIQTPHAANWKGY